MMKILITVLPLLLTVVISFSAIFSLFAVAVEARPLPSNSKNKNSKDKEEEQCSSPFGTLIGQHVFTQQLAVSPPALNRNATVKMDFYSNCNGDFVSNQFTYVNLVEQVFGGAKSFYSQQCDLTSECPQQIFAGMKEQCVNAGRISLMKKFGAVFASIPYAVDIFDLPNVTQFAIVPNSNSTRASSSSSKSCKCSVKTAAFPGFINNQTTTPPQIGDLLIYDTEGPGMSPTGHVCTVVGVDQQNQFVDVVEENWSNEPWPAAAGNNGVQRDYSRRIQYLVDVESGRQQLVNEPYHIIGWKRVGELIN